MRKNKLLAQKREFSILSLDDDQLMTETVQSYFQAAGYAVDIENDPLAAVERIRTGSYDILLLDFLMRPICGDEVVRQIRTFNKDLFIILLTGHKSMAPPIRTIRELDIQGYYEKSDRFDQLELLVESCAKSIRQMRIIRSYRDGLQSIIEQSGPLSAVASVEGCMKAIQTQLSSLFAGQDCFVYLDLPTVQQTMQMELSGFAESSYLGSGIYADARKQVCDGFSAADSTVHSCSVLEEQDTLAVALSANKLQYGVLGIHNPGDFSPDSLQLFEIYAKQVGSIVNSLLLRLLLQMRNQELGCAYAALRKTYMETVDTMRQMVDAKDVYTRGHSDRVSFYAAAIARAMGKDDKYIERLRIAGLFHDIGKIGIPDEILCKNGKLTRQEYAQIQLHPTKGRQLLSAISSFRDILPTIEAHHEWYNGNGYPGLVQGENIPEEARIISVADAFDAMTSKRTYRDSLSLPRAVEELKNGRGTQFDPKIADVFLAILADADKLETQLAQAFPDETVGFKKA